MSGRSNLGQAASSKLRTVLTDDIQIGIEISQLPPRNSSSVVWTAVGGAFGNLVKINLVTGGTKSIVIDDVPRRMTKFTVGHKTGRTVYTKVANAQGFLGGKYGCNGTAKTWYYDFANRDLYVYPEAGVDLNTRICFAWVLYHVANYPKHLAGYFYEPRLLSDSNAFETEISVGDKFFTAQPASGGGISLINSDGFYDRLSMDYEWRAGRHTLRQGIDTDNITATMVEYNVPEGPSSPIAGTIDGDYTVVRSSVVDSVSRTDEFFSMEFMALAKRLDVPVHQMTYDTIADSGDHPNQNAYLNMDGEAEGIPQAVVYGDNDKSGTAEVNFKKAAPVVVVDKGTKQPTGDGWASRKYKIGAVLQDPDNGSNHGYQNISKVLLRRGSNFSIIASSLYSLTENNTVINGSSSLVMYDTDEVRALVKGVRDVAGKYTGGTRTDSIKLPWDVIQHVLMTLAGFSPEEVNIPSMTRGPQALTGTCTFTAGSTAVTGVSTLFNTEVAVNDYIKLSTDTDIYYQRVSTVNSNISITLAANYGGTGGAGTGYDTIIKTINGINYIGTLTPPAWTDNVKVRMHGDDGGTAQELIDLLLRSIRGILYEDERGRATLALLDTHMDETDMVLTDAEIADFSETLGVEQLIPRIILEFDYHPAAKKFRRVKSADTTNGVVNNYAGALFGYERGGKSKRHHKFGADGGAAVEYITTALSNRASAKLLANNYFQTWTRDQIYYKLTDVLGRSIGLHEGSKLIIRRSRGMGGPLDRKLLWIRKAGKSWSSSGMEITESCEAK